MTNFRADLVKNSEASHSTMIDQGASVGLGSRYFFYKFRRKMVPIEAIFAG